MYFYSFTKGFRNFAVRTVTGLDGWFLIGGFKKLVSDAAGAYLQKLSQIKQLWSSLSHASPVL